ncbi:DUF2511 domain-containing protein [Serratia marcescens]|uniref:DUF2511 domain-containing protein n=1 Tax=Serratia marcescens TaxID=615 RepID=A0A939SV50_SERMA|nr:DUF2511 domain-containing protein [Serratia marcescens]
MNITKLEYGKQWAFTKEEVTLQCRSDGSAVRAQQQHSDAIPLNDAAEQQVKRPSARATAGGAPAGRPCRTGEK